MEKQKKYSYPEVAARVETVRGIYSAIGEPLPAETLIDLSRHLGSALALAEEAPPRKKKKQLLS